MIFCQSRLAFRATNSIRVLRSNLNRAVFYSTSGSQNTLVQSDLQELRSLIDKYRLTPDELSSNPKIRNSNTLLTPTFDYSMIASHMDEMKANIKMRKLPEELLEKLPIIVELYDKFRNLNGLRIKCQTERKSLQKQVSSKSVTAEARAQLLVTLTTLKNEISIYDELIESIQYRLLYETDKMPNRISADVPEEQKTLGYINIEAKKPVTPYNHVDIGIKLGLIDIASASKISGTSWYFLMGDAVSLELALVQYAMSKARKRGFINIMPPSIVKQEVAHACGFKPRDLNGEQQIYNLAFQGADLCLTGTAEIPLAGWGINKVFDAKAEADDIPVKLVGVNRSYRAEAGARGADTKGLYRVHEFTKVELFAYVKGEDSVSEQMLEDILDLQKEIIQDLGLCARILILPGDDLGNPAYKKYDIEAWMPGRKDWGEVTSASNCLDYQSRRMNTKIQLYDNNKKTSKEFVHTLNGTAMAVPRVIVAILENFYDESTSKVKIPEVLRRYMDDKEYLEVTKK